MMNDHEMSMITKIANNPKSSNDFDAKASKMNRKLKAKLFEQRRCNNNKDGRHAAAARNESGEPTSWCIS
jgi:hypothetical protein